MAGRSVDDKALDLLARHRLRLVREESSPARKVFVCASSNDPFHVYRLSVDAEGRGECGCAATRKCSHLAAAYIWLAVLRRRRNDGSL